MDKPVTPERLDELIKLSFDGAVYGGASWQMSKALCELRELRHRTEAMRKYCQHRIDCSMAAPRMREFAAPVCSCGLDALLAPDAGT